MYLNTCFLQSQREKKERDALIECILLNGEIGEGLLFFIDFIVFLGQQQHNQMENLIKL